MARKTISIPDLIWMFHEKLKEYDDHHFGRISLAIIRGDNDHWQVVLQRRLPKPYPELAKRISEIEKRLRRQYTLAAE